MAEAACDAIKLEGGRRDGRPRQGDCGGRNSSLRSLGIDSPKRQPRLGGFRLQGKGAAAAAQKIIEDAKDSRRSRCAFCILLELVPDRVCKIITERAENCLIMSLGGGPDAHGQLLIYHDMFGLYPKFKPKMAKVFGNAGEVILNGLQQYVKEVGDGTFPGKENYFGIKDEEYDELIRDLGE